MPPFIYRLRDADFEARYAVPKEGDSEIVYQIEQPRPLFNLGSSTLGTKRQKGDLRNELLQDEHCQGSLSLNYHPNLDYGLPMIAKPTLGKIDRTTAVLWETLSIFNLLSSTKKISTNKIELIKQVEKVQQKVFKDKTKREYAGGSADLTIFLTSEVEVDEMVAVQVILSELPKYFDQLKVKGSMVLQIFGIKTRIMLDLVYLLTSYFQTAYLIKPESVSNIYHESYLVLTGLIKKTKLNFGLNTSGGYPYSLKLEPHDIFRRIVQCMNNQLLGLEMQQFAATRDYLHQKIYEGNTNQDYIDTQTANAHQWVDLFSDPESISRVLQDQLTTSTTLCASHFSFEVDEIETPIVL